MSGGDGIRVPLSVLQEQMLRFQAWAPSAAAFNATVRRRLAPPCDAGAVATALDLVLARHEALRTSLPVDPATGRRYQSIAPALSLDLGRAELGGLEPAARGRELAARTVAQNAAPFDPSAGPLLRAELVGLGGGEAALVLTVDHLVCDETSMAILVRELDLAYRAVPGGGHPPLAPLPVQYADFALWQRQWLTPERLAAERAWWAGALRDMPPPAVLPYDRPAPARPSGAVGHVAFAVPHHVAAGAHRLARSARTSLFAVLVTAVQRLLASLGGGDDVAVATTLSGRYHPDLEGVVGLFAAVALVRTDLAGAGSFEAALARTRASVLGMFENQHVPFSDVWAGVLAERRESGAGPPETVTSVSVELFPVAGGARARGTTVLAAGPGDEDTYHLADELDVNANRLNFRFLTDGDGLWGQLRYQLDRFDRPTVEGLAAELQQVLAAGAGRG
ncbi:MAG: condensation domain-containing protein [Actinobacteria bacterium]|nr:condensation domain-containing protein [Actinomycetota bacterium]